MSQDIQRADPSLRRLTVIILAIASALAIGAVLGFNRWFVDYATTVTTTDLIVNMRRWLAVAVTASGVCLLILAGYAAHLARRTLAQRRWPPEGFRVMRDTPIRRDAQAARIGRLLNVVAVSLVLVAVAVGVVSWRLFSTGH